ncbi:MAG: hypothetical protein A2632_01360 [Candidatus Pacebacteria bacterium RIFCSPHIGHO2_01_FULL_46_16]|nr:MAG: hypothetical protein A2632_01360 [Candidatus Pacebacteria bacterium RIFCSPHIGHO2_01_FULL_46_16]
MHTEILSQEQLKLLPLVEQYKDSHYLVGGTALALQFGHRRSIDFDLFSNQPLEPVKVLQQVKAVSSVDRVLVSSSDELTLIANGVKMTWYNFGFTIPVAFEAEFCRLPDSLTIGAMKLFALGHRAKWKDYLDLYFILKEFSLEQLVARTKDLFSSAFEEKLARIQLTYFDDISYSEEINFMPDFVVEDAVVKQTLTQIALG